ncbi:MAG TPA: riboflavin synthase [Polyangiaceae bacterium]|nr:riboflavin synthase [Polyangiaceae bacterium]
MFTGLVQAVGELRLLEQHPQGQRLAVTAPWTDLQLGESISVDGACLTVSELTAEGFLVDISAETGRRTTLGELSESRAVNLERALRPSDRLGGHLVLGHVDQVAVVTGRSELAVGLTLRVRLDPVLLRLVAEKGSVCLNGVSLTVNAVSDVEFEVTLIPHTLANTNLKDAVVGTKLNFEADVMARYAARLLTA